MPDPLRRALAALGRFFTGPTIPEKSRAMYRRHMAYVLFDAVAKGIMANAPVMALKGMGSPDWQMALQLSISSLGMFLVLYLGGFMANRRKKPFVMWPGVLYAGAALLMAATDNVLVFMILLGVWSMFDVLTRPPLTAIIRLNYPATFRGTATGEIRKWFYIVFVFSGLLAGWLLDLVVAAPATMIKVQMLVAGAMALVALWYFRGIRVDEPGLGDATRARANPWRHLRQAIEIVRSNARFRRYLIWGFIYAFGALVYVAFIPSFLVHELRYSYTASSIMIHVLPSLIAFLSTGVIGRWVDKVSTWKAWGAMRIGWGLDPIILAMTPIAMTVFPAAVFVLPTLGRVSRGVVMGGSWILWWQVSVNHFAPPGGDTTRYMGVMLFMNGIARLLAPIAGAILIETSTKGAVMILGGAMVLITSAVSFYEYSREQHEKRLETMASFEDSFSR